MLRLGIAMKRIRPSLPRQNGRHERMHLALKGGTRPRGMNSLQQQARFDAVVQGYNTERPHDASRIVQLDRYVRALFACRQLRRPWAPWRVAIPVERHRFEDD